MANLHATPQHLFSKVPTVQVQRSAFDRSHNHKTTLNASYLIPIYVDEVLPGDTFNLSHSIYTRLISPLDVPMMDNLHMDTFYFFVPNRLIWNHWKEFMGENKRPHQGTVEYTIPQIQINSAFAINSIYDYMGLPYGVTGYTVSALPFRAYNLVYNFWFKDSSLIDWITENDGDGPDNMSDYTLRRRGKRFDYFTSSLCQPSSGDPVDLPLGTTAPVIGNGNALGLYGTTGSGNVPSVNCYLYESNVNGVGDMMRSIYSPNPPSAGSAVTTTGSLNNETFVGVSKDPNKSGLIVDLSSATNATIGTLKQAFMLQNFNIINMRYGGLTSLYKDVLYAHFGVISPDSRLQIPEFLGGSHDILQMSVVAQTSESDTTKQGNLSAFMYGGSFKNGFVKSFDEHGWIIGLMCIYADLTYQQGLNRMWSRQTKLDFYWPEFANLEDQTILNKEIYTQGNAQDDEVFGYTERNAEYKFYPNRITGELRSTYSQSLDIWHLAQVFGNLPTLSQDFIEENVPIDRIVAVTDEVQFVSDMHFNLKCVRPMPLYNDPLKWFMRA